MSQIDISVNLLESDSEITQKILNALAKDINYYCSKAIANIKNVIQIHTRPFFENHPTTLELINGDLVGHFGFPAGTSQSIVRSIIDVIINNIEVIYKPVSVVGNGFSNGGIQIGVLLAGFSDVLSLPMSNVISSTPGNVQSLPWLEWLLIRGDSIIISEHEISFGPRGRSGRAIMINSNSGVWRVPPQHAGTIDDNWLTRCLLQAGNGYADMVLRIVEHEIKRI